MQDKMTCVLKRLKFYGLRSFKENQDPNQVHSFHVINFNNKVTILKGRNGAGKTVNYLNPLL